MIKNLKKKLKIPPPVEDADAVNKIYVDTLSDETKRYVNSVTPFLNQQNEYVATNNINMREFTLQNVGDPTNAKNVATKEYIDNSGGGAFEARYGRYNAKGPLYIGGQKIGGIRDEFSHSGHRYLYRKFHSKFHCVWSSLSENEYRSGKSYDTKTRNRFDSFGLTGRRIPLLHKTAARTALGRIFYMILIWFRKWLKKTILI